MPRMVAIGAMMVILGVASAQGATDVVTNRYDTNRTAANLTETTLTPSTVSASSFGKLWTYPLDGAVFAQPLYVRDVAVTGSISTHNVLYVATMNDVVYALDADTPQAPLWIHDYRSATASPATPFDITAASTGMGIGSTPVIDLPNNRMYLVAETLEGGAYVQRLHEIDIRSGAELASAVITATANGITFNPRMHSQRPGLALSGGQVWIGFGSTIPGDFSPWYGWVMTYNMNTLAQSGAFVTTTGGGGGIWQSGAAPTVDAAGNVYYVTGNGVGQRYDGTRNFQESLLQFTYSGGLKLSNWYTAADWSTLDTYDLDMSAGGSSLIPGTSLIAFGGKIGLERVLNTSNLGGYTAADSQVVQKLQIGPVPDYVADDGDRILGIAYWTRGAKNSLLFAWPGLSALTSYTFNGSQFALEQQNTLNLYGEPCAVLSLSANGATPGSGILWVARDLGPGKHVGQVGVIEAYDADNISQLLWSSTTNIARDDVISTGRFVIPVVNNGKLYMATASNALQIYGLLPSTAGVTPQLPLEESTSEPSTQARAVSLQPVGYLNYRVRHQNFIGYISAIDGLSSAVDVSDSSFVVRQGLGKASCYSFEAKGYPGYFLSNASLEVRLIENDGSSSFASDATFCAQPGLAGNGVSLQPLALPGYYLRHRDFQLWIDKLGSINPGTYNADASFNIVDPGEVSLQSVNYPGHFVRQQDFKGALSPISAASVVTDKLDAAFNVRPGLAGSCVTFESRRYPGYYLRHQNFELFLMQNDGSTLFAEDSTFCPVAGRAGSGTSFESVNYPGYYIRHWDFLLWLDPPTNGAHSPSTFNADATFTPQGTF